MKKYLAFIIFIFIGYNSTAQETISITGPTSVEVGIPYNYNLTFNPLTPLPTNYNGVQANSVIITEWIISTQTNGGGTTPQTTGYIGSSSNPTSYYYDGTYNNSSNINRTIQWGDSTFLRSDKITVKVSGIYRNSNTGQNIAYFNYVTAELNISTVERILEPIIAGPSLIGSCGVQTNSTYSISNQTYANRYEWSVTGGASIIGSNSGTSITVSPPPSPLTGTHDVICTVKRSSGNPFYTRTSSKNVTRPFSSNAAISGPTNLCTGTANYTISNIVAGQTVAWSLSNPAISSLTNLTSTGATVSFMSIAAQTLTATITNQCGQISIKTFVINTGATTFTSAAVLSGSTSFCTGSNLYTISGVLAGQTVSWGLSDNSIANLSGSTNTQTTVNFTGSGAQTLTATITNSCGQTSIKTIQIYGGVPTFSSFTCGSGAPFCSGSVCICDGCLPSLDLTSLVTANMNGQTTTERNLASNWQWQKLNNNIVITTNTGNKTYIAANLLGATGFQVRAKNACGWSQWFTLNFDVVSCARLASPASNLYTISPNPARSIVNIELKDKAHTPENDYLLSGELFNLKGVSKSKIEIKDHKATFSVIGLPKGIYILKIYLNNKVETHQIAVE